jgi:uncharacterized protein with HEPN domain
MKGNKADSIRLQHIRDAVNTIEKQCRDKKFDEFARDEILVLAVVKLIEIIGEASNRISSSFKNKHKDIKWKEIIGMRNILIHEYFGIDDKIIWDVVTNDLPPLKQKINDLLI